MTEKKPKNTFMSILLVIFTAIIAVVVVFAMASSTSIIGEAMAFVLALVAFIFLIGLAYTQLRQD